jgi:hypothetical protein
MSDINGGQSPNPNGSPIQPGTLFTGPLLAGGVIHSDGTGNLAALGGTTGTANVGYAQMAQTAVITQATNGVTAGVFTTNIVIPAQSQITDIYLMVTTAWTGAASTLGIGNTVSATAYTAAASITASALGQLVSPGSISPGTNATEVGNWDNVGSTDVQIVVTSANTGSGVGTLTVFYLQGINNAS